MVDGVEIGEGLCEFPAADGGASDEYDIGSGWRAFVEGLFEFLDIGFPAFGRFFCGGRFFIGVGVAGSRERAGGMQRGEECDGDQECEQVECAVPQGKSHGWGGSGWGWVAGKL